MDGDRRVDDSWDFFDTAPKSPGADVPRNDPKPVKSVTPPVRPRSAKPVSIPTSDLSSSTQDTITDRDEKEKRRPSRSPSGSGRSRSNSYSSYTDSETEEKDKDHSKGGKRDSKGSRKMYSDSDGSHSSRSRSRTASSRSRSTSSTGSESRTQSISKSEDRPGNPVAKSDQSLPHRGRSRLGEDEYSSSAYSDGNEEGKNNSRTPNPAVRKGGKRNAWGDEPSREDSITMPSSSTRNRPKTAKGSKGVAGAAWRRRSGSQSEDSDALSDSDMTDVSPMDSPRGKGKAKRGLVAAREPEIVQFQPLPLTDIDDTEDPTDSEHTGQNGLDLEILMKAVGELEKQKRLQQNSRRVMFAPMTLKRSEKNNYTFNTAKSRDIERENQRLLKEIVRRVSKTSEKKKPGPPSHSQAMYKLTASAINREREMKRIESENLAFLKRLQKVKPTKAICRDHQIKDFNSTMLHGVPMAALHPISRAGSRSGSRSGFADSASSIGSRTRSVSSLTSAMSSVRSGQSSRHGSRPGSATKRVDTRPQWNDRW